MADLPRPDVNVTPGKDGSKDLVDVKISRSGDTGGSHEYRGEGYSKDSATADVIKQILNDPATAEYLPAKGEKVDPPHRPVDPSAKLATDVTGFWAALYDLRKRSYY